jgi:cytosine/adenosine deaminase-related metal-dependent hydrolase
VGFGDELGAIERGFYADLVVLRGDGPYLRPRSDVVGSLVYVETASDVDTVIASGRVVVRGGTVLTVDEPRLRARAQEAADRLRRQNAAGWAMAAEIAPYLSTACRAAAVTPYPVNRYAAPVP